MHVIRVLCYVGFDDDAKSVDAQTAVMALYLKVKGVLDRLVGDVRVDMNVTVSDHDAFLDLQHWFEAGCLDMPGNHATVMFTPAHAPNAPYSPLLQLETPTQASHTVVLYPGASTLELHLGELCPEVAHYPWGSVVPSGWAPQGDITFAHYDMGADLLKFWSAV